jgi:hypothetical protein
MKFNQNNDQIESSLDSLNMQMYNAQSSYHDHHQSPSSSFLSLTNNWLSLGRYFDSTQLLKNRIMSILVDESLLVASSTAIQHLILNQFLSSTRDSLESQFRQESFSFLNNVVSNDIRSRRLHLNSLIKTSVALSDFQKIMKSNIGYRVVYTLLSLGCTFVLSKTGFQSIGNLFSFVTYGILDESNPKWMILCVCSLLKSLVSYHLYDVIMYIVKYILRGYIVSNATTQEEKILSKYMSQDAVNQLLEYRFNNTTNISFNNYITFISDKMIKIIDQIAIINDQYKEDTQTDAEEQPKEKSFKQTINETYNTMVDIFKQNLRILERGEAWAKENNSYHIIEERAVIQVYEHLDNIERISSSVLQIYLSQHPQTRTQLVNQIISNINESLTTNTYSHKKSKDLNTILQVDLHTALLEFKKHGILVEQTFKDQVPTTLLPFYKSEYSIESMIDLLEIPIRLFCVIISDTFISQSFGIQYKTITIPPPPPSFQLQTN